MRNIAIGSFTSDGNAKTVVCGFVPEAVFLVNSDGKLTGLYFCKAEQTNVVGDLSKCVIAGAAVDGVSISDGGLDPATSGVAGYLGTLGEGFTVAATATCPENANGDTVRYIALRGDILNVPAVVVST